MVFSPHLLSIYLVVGFYSSMWHLASLYGLKKSMTNYNLNDFVVAN